jgi:Ca2+-binding EF-hand superfamily protein
MFIFARYALLQLAALVILGCATLAYAGEIDPDTLATLKTNFAKADKDKDGKLTKEECSAGMPRIYRGFDRIDSDGRGYITLDQILTFVANR